MIFFNKKDKDKEEKKPSEESKNEEKQNEEKIPDSERLVTGQILATVIVEMLGKPKEHLTKTLNKYVDEIKNNNVYSVVSLDIAEPIEVEDSDMFSTFVELDVWFKNTNVLIAFCFDYMPSSVDIMQPEELKYSSKDFSGFLNDMQARLHNTDMLLKNLKEQTANLNKNSNELLKNLVLICLSKKALTADELAKFAGIDSKHLIPFLIKFEEKGILKKDGERYSLTS